MAEALAIEAGELDVWPSSAMTRSRRLKAFFQAWMKVGEGLVAEVIGGLGVGVVGAEGLEEALDLVGGHEARGDDLIAAT